MNAGLWKVIGLVVLAFAYSAGLFISGYSYAQKGRGNAVVASLENDKELVKEAAVEARVIEKQVKKHVDKIKNIADTTGCADIGADSAINESLLNIYRATKGPSID